MAAIRTQVYLTKDQRARLDERARVEHKTMAQLIREAVDAFLGSKDPDEILKETFGIAPDFKIPALRERWSARDRRLWGDEPPR